MYSNAELDAKNDDHSDIKAETCTLKRAPLDSEHTLFDCVHCSVVESETTSAAACQSLAPTHSSLVNNVMDPSQLIAHALPNMNDECSYSKLNNTEQREVSFQQ